MQIPESYVNERVDHLGVGAGVCEERGLAAYLDRLAGETNRQVSVGTATVAMILNGLGFSNRRLYMALLSSIFLEMTAYELVLLSRFDLVRLNFTRFVAAQNIKRLLLAAIRFNRHYRSSGLELPRIMVRIVFRQTHTDESADNPASRGAYCRTRQDRYQDSACNHGTDSGDQECSRHPKETSKDSPAHSISAFINLPPPLFLSHFGLFISCRHRLPSDCGFTFFLFSSLLFLAPHPIYRHFRHRYPAYRRIARIRRANNRE